jgi:hypothetical protein
MGATAAALAALVTVAAAKESRPVRPPLPSPAEIARLPKDGGPSWNRLVFEPSPYLLQHAGNPVDWWPWGPEAFEEARRLDRPVFLSIGYSTCHWCHVMEHESFEDEAVAKLMNEHFICIKVDREERPDLDQVYMTVTQAVTGSGGWPMTVILTPDRKPFWAGTYIPKESRYGRPGMLDLVPALAEVWKTRRDHVLETSSNIVADLAQMTGGAPGADLDAAVLTTAYEQLSRRFEPRHGGFGQAPKFPTPHDLSFLLRYWKRTGEPHALEMVEKTLVEMRRGGIFDHVGFGFHRYSTDAQWLLPHFEKMLYDQAMLAIAYLEAYRATGKPEHAEVAREVFTYVLRDMTAPEGGFTSAEDADSEGVEGKFYVWTPEEVARVLGAEDGRLYCEVFNVVPGGNFRDQATGQMPGESIVHLKVSLEEHAAARKVDVALLRRRLEACRARLFAEREKRVHPLEDDKVLTDWNGLMIAALAMGARTVGEPRYADAARKAADFALAHLRDRDGRLLKRWRGGKAGLPAHLEDHAFLAWGLLELYEATFDARYLRESQAITVLMLAHFWDAAGGGFFLTADDGEKLLVRAKESHDGAIPSGNSVAALVLLRLARMTGDVELEKKAAATFRAFSGNAARGASAHCFLMQAVDFAVGQSHEVVVVGDPVAPATQAMVTTLRKPFVPNAVFLLRPPGASPEITRLAPYTATMAPLDGRPTAYVCRNFACSAPTTEAAKAVELLTIMPPVGRK